MLGKEEFIEIIQKYGRYQSSLILKVSTRTIDRWIHKFHLNNKNYGRKNISHQNICEIKDLYLSGKTQKEIANLYNLSQPMISKILSHKNYGIVVTGKTQIEIDHGN